MLVPGVSGAAGSDALDPVRVAMAAFDPARAGLVVLLSPHGPAAGIYAQPAGGLDRFGVPGRSMERNTDRRWRARLADLWGRPVIHEEADHGVVVPLLVCGGFPAPVIAATLGEGASAEKAVSEALELAAAVTALDTGVAFIASANLGVALAPQAPLTEEPGALQAEMRLLKALDEDASALVEVASELGTRGSCGAGPVAAAGALAGRRRLHRRAYEAPFGVGYLVASVGAG